MAIAPCGSITIESAPYRGSGHWYVYNCYIQLHSKSILEYLHLSDEVMASREITVNDLHHKRKIKLNIQYPLRGAHNSLKSTPPTLVASPKYGYMLSRAFANWKKILSHPVPINLTPNRDNIWRNWAAMCRNLISVIYDSVQICKVLLHICLHLMHHLLWCS